MERRLGRMVRSMSLTKMLHFSHSGTWPSAVDILEAEEELIIYMDVSGVDPDKLQVTAEKDFLTVTGEREFPLHDLCCIHQLEIDYGPFQRSIKLPVAVEIGDTTSECKNGFLIVKLPKAKSKGKVNVKIT